MPDAIGNIVTDIGTKALDAMWMRSNAISNNISNSDTTGYKAKSVEFENQLSNALSGNSISEEQLSSVNPTEVEDSGTYGANANGVDLEDQMVSLSRNQYQYSYLERGISDQLTMLLAAARGGK
jgi:flagellar basal-body rod protein FlgB